MKKTTKKYQTPAIVEKKVKINFFKTNNRLFDSLDELIAPKALAASTSSVGGGGSCFLKGTEILQASGVKKKIEDIVEGDVLVSYDTHKKQLTIDTVVEIIHSHGVSGGYVIINNKIKVTGYHRFWTNRKIWKNADTLQIGDKLLDKNRKEVIVTSVETVPGTYDVYNLELEHDTHNYFAVNMLVHNSPAS